jgi:hypothetical protein
MLIKKSKITFYIFMILFLMYACHSGPKVVEGEPADVGAPVGRMENQEMMNTPSGNNPEEHRVVVEEALNTDRYTYLHVTENGNKFWIAIPRKEIQIGGGYYYQGGLLKRNFESKEFNRVFETIYLVSDVVPLSGNSGMVNGQERTQNHSVHSQASLEQVEPVEGAIVLSALFSHPDEYQGKLIKVTGKCVKVNPMIMGRNWVHIQDGSGDHLDLTVTTNDQVQVGDIVTMEGLIALNKDFGAGYRYEVIMENASLK